MKQKNKIIEYIITISIGTILQIISYYGSYSEKQDWGLVFKEIFSDFGYAIGFNIFILIPIIWIIIDARKNKKKD